MDVLRLDVTVHDRLLVQIVHSRDKLPYNVGGFHLRKSTIGDHTLVQSATMHHLVYEVDLLLVFVHFNRLADVRMIKLFEELDLLKKLSSLTKLKVLLAHHLDCSSDARNLVDTTTHTAESSLTDVLVQVIVVLNVVFVAQVELLWV